MKRLLTLLLTIWLTTTASSAMAQLCTASSTSLAFGTYDPKSSANVDNIGSITVTCQATLSLLIGYTVHLSAGYSTSLAQRKMSNGTTTLNYQVYTNSARTTIWGDGTSGTTSVSDGYLLQVLTPVTKTYSVYGRITGSQNVYAGSYIDTLTILITY